MYKKDFEAPGVDVIDLINTGEQIIDATLPFINELIQKIQDEGDPTNVHTPKGRTAHILATEALDKLQDQKLALHDKYFAELIEKGEITE